MSVIKKIVTKLTFKQNSSDQEKIDGKEREVYIISTSVSKIWDMRASFFGPYPASEAYNGYQVGQWLNNSLSKNNPWLFLSPKYGFLRPDELISDYKVTFDDPKSNPITDLALRKQVLEKELQGIPLRNFGKVHVVDRNLDIKKKVEVAFDGIALVDWMGFGEIV